MNTWAGRRAPEMKTREFSFDLPEDLIAQEPCADREAARLLVLDRATGRTTDSSVLSLADWVEPGTVMVLNETRVRKARLFAAGGTGRPVELLLLRQVSPSSWKALVGRSRRRRAGSLYALPGGRTARLEDEAAVDGTRLVSIDPPIDPAYLEEHGHVPLPPYIKRADTAADGERYQTVYSRVSGSAAAPTAGLHLTQGLLDGLEARGVETVRITLHVGLGTFLPIRSEDIEAHVMHEEEYCIPCEAAEAVNRALEENRRVMAVGTTSVRALESAGRDGRVVPGTGSTGIFITPGYRFRIVERMFTNFHTPQSTLLVLVSAFAGRELILRTYREAVEKRYRFFSYGDAMLIR